MMLYRWDLFGLPIFSIGAVLTVLAAALTLVSMVELPARGAGRS